MTAVRQIRDDLERFFGEILAADLQGRPLHIALGSELPSRFTPSGTAGWTSTNLPTLLARHHPRWTTPGPSLVVCDGTIREDVRAAYPHIDSDAFLDDAVARRMPSIATHELAHNLSRQVIYRDCRPRAGVTMPQHEIATLKGLAAMSAAEETEQSPRILGHDWQFVRVVVHLIDRVRRFPFVDCPVHPTAVMDHTVYGINPLSEYRQTLLGELHRLRGVTFAEIRETRVPKWFARLWAQDVRRHAGCSVCRISQDQIDERFLT